MISFKCRMFYFLARNAHFLRGRWKKEVFDMNTSITGFRLRCEKGAGRFRIPEGIEIKEDILDGMHSEWIIPQGADRKKLILYVHGGGYVSGSCSDHRGFVSKFARYTGVTNLIYDYRLAPENPFPAALEDSVNIYLRILSSGYDPKNIIIAGESAGGGLCLAILLALKEWNVPLPSAAVAISPWTDLSCNDESYKTKNRVSPAPLMSWQVFSKHYIGENNPTMHLISPLYGDSKGLPPVYINSGMDDELYDGGYKFYLKAREAGVDITFKAGAGMIHCYPLLAPLFPEATEAMNEIAGFVRQHLNLS
jgi:epsilon-lactone hydrolase